MKYKPFYKILSIAAFSIASFYFVSVLIRNISLLPTISINISNLAVICGSIGLYLIVMVVGGLVWYLLLRATGEPVGLMTALVVFFISQFAKYIPGNFAHHLGRVALARHYEMQIGRVLYSMIIETGWAIASSALLVMLLLVFNDNYIVREFHNALSTTKVSLLFFGALSVPLVIGYILRNPFGPIKKMINQDVLKPDIFRLCLCFLIDMLVFLLMGYIASFLAQTLLGIQSTDLSVMTVVFTIAWIAGFLTIGAPAGIGVREAIIVAALTPIHGENISILLTVLLRIISVLGDLTIFLSGLTMKHFLDKSKHVIRVT